MLSGAGANERRQRQNDVLIALDLQIYYFWFARDRNKMHDSIGESFYVLSLHWEALSSFKFIFFFFKIVFQLLGCTDTSFKYISLAH